MDVRVNQLAVSREASLVFLRIASQALLVNSRSNQQVTEMAPTLV